MQAKAKKEALEMIATKGAEHAKRCKERVFVGWANCKSCEIAEEIRKFHRAVYGRATA